MSWVAVVLSLPGGRGALLLIAVKVRPNAGRLPKDGRGVPAVIRRAAGLG